MTEIKRYKKLESKPFIRKILKALDEGPKSQTELLKLKLIANTRGRPRPVTKQYLQKTLQELYKFKRIGWLERTPNNLNFLKEIYHITIITANKPIV